MNFDEKEMLVRIDERVKHIRVDVKNISTRVEGFSKTFVSWTALKFVLGALVVLFAGIKLFASNAIDALFALL